MSQSPQEGFVGGIQACPDNPYDGHTLDEQLDQMERLTGKLPAMTFTDKGYKGHGVPEERSRVLISGTRKPGYLPRDYTQLSVQERPGYSISISFRIQAT